METLVSFVERNIGRLTGLFILLVIALIATVSVSSESMIERNSKNVLMLVKPSNHRTGGTGFEVKAPSGKTYTITNAHVCGLSEMGIMHVRRPDGRAYALRMLEISDKTDLCILEGVNDTGSLLADKMIMREEVTVIGHPHLLPLTITQGRALSPFTVTLEVGENVAPEACVGPGMHLINMEGTLADILFSVKNICTRDFSAIYTNAKILPGNSGSPVFNKSGKVVGVIFAGDQDGTAGFFIPLEDLREFLSVY